MLNTVYETISAYRERCFYCKRDGKFEDQICQVCKEAFDGYIPLIELEVLNTSKHGMAFTITSDALEFATGQRIIIEADTTFKDVLVRTTIDSSIFKDFPLRISVLSE